MGDEGLATPPIEDRRPRYFGSPDNQRLQRNAQAIWRLIGCDSRFCCHGRAVSLADGGEETIPLQAALAQLQGVGICDAVPADEAEARSLALEALGLVVDRLEVYRGARQPIDAARAVMVATPLPEDLTCTAIDDGTSATELLALDSFVQQHGASSLPMASFLVDKGARSVCFIARDGAGDIVGSCAAGAHFQPRHRRCDEAFWGMLATRDDRRGQGIALHLGATTMLAMQQRYGFEAFVTAVKQGNAASERACTRLGLRPDGSCAIFAIDREYFAP